MVKTLRINNKTSNYLIKIGNGSFFSFFNNLLKSNTDNFVLIDSIVYKKFSTYFKNIKKNNIHIIKIKCSENIKSLSSYENLLIKLLNKKINRSSNIIAIGGGTLGDLSGFVASTILRGVKLILVPTTLLSQVDSSVGGKNGVNSKFGKNLIGTFYQPQTVIIDPIFLKYLPKKEIRSGYAEIVKHALINDKIFFKWLKKYYKDIYNLKNKQLNYAIEKSIKIKSKYITKDEKEVLKNSSSRAILNFGHTFGHALESLNRYKSSLTHGEAISVGMILASKISYSIGNITEKEYSEIISHFKKCSLPIKNKLIFDNKFFRLLINDKKNQGKKINLILLKKIGRAYFARNFDLKKIKFLTIN